MTAIMHPRHLLLFGDQTENLVSTIKELYSKSQTSLYLRHFLQSAQDAVHREALDFSCSKTKKIRFSSFASLAEASVDEKYSDVVSRTLLLCVAQLGSLVMLVENNPRLLDREYSSRLVILGYCTGLLPAVAAATTHSMVELLALAPEIITTSLRLGLEADNRSRSLEDCNQSWARAVCGVSTDYLRNTLEEFHKDNGIPPHKRAYISAIYTLSTTVSGPPSTLDQFFSLEQLKKNRISILPLPITAVFHAQHLGAPDLARIVKPGSHFDNFALKDTQMISTSSGLPYQPQSLESLLSNIVDDILQKPIDNVRVFDGLCLNLSKKCVLVTPIGPNSSLKRLVKSLKEADIEVQVENSERSGPHGITDSLAFEDIAIVGMSGRFPGAETLKEFWTVLESGLDLHREVPPDRFDVRTHYDPTGKRQNTTSTPYGCFLDRPGFFDARLFNMSPREAAQTDPGQRLLLMTTYEALEMAGYTQEHNLDDRDPQVGTFFGQTIDDWKEYNAAENVDMYYVTGGIRAFSAGRVNYHFKWEGPSYSVDSACSSSLLAIQLACSSLLSRDCNMAVAGGSNILTGCNMFSGLSRGSFLSQTGSCKTFDSEADGYCRGDGVGVVVLKRLNDAMANRDNILAVVKAVATNHSAQAISITHPHVETQEKLFNEVLLRASTEPEDVDYVELHGTGTQAGDAAESSSVMNVLAKTPRSHPLVMGSIKPNVGHGEAVAGVTSLIKTLMMLQNEKILPHVGIKGQINPKLPAFADYNVQIASSQTFKRQDKKRTILINNFSAAGGNTSVVIKDGPEVKVEGVDPRTSHVVAVSAKTPFSLHKNVLQLLDFLKTSSSTLPDIAYTTTARRLHHPLRRSYTVKDTAELSKALGKEIGAWTDPKPTNEAPSVAFTFPGQGAQILGVADQLYKSSCYFRERIHEYDSLCRQQGLPSFLAVVTGTSTTTPSPAENQLCLVAAELALASLWKSWGIVPSVVIGHSLGEYAALCVAGVLSTSDMLFLVARRAEQMQLHCTPHTHRMLAVRLGVGAVQQTISATQLPSLEIACINGPSATVISGPSETVAILQQKLQAEGVMTTLLEVPYSFHSRQMDTILGPYEAIARNVHFAKPKIPVASTLLGEIVVDSGIFGASYLVRQARHTVDFLAALNSCVSEGLVNDRTLWMESGPGATCLSFVKATLNVPLERTLATLEPNKDCWPTITKNLSSAYKHGIHVKWTDYHKEHKKALRLVELPLYAFDLKNYWIDYRSRLSEASEVPVPEPVLTSTSTCLQRVVEEDFGSSGAQVTFASDFGDQELSTMARGHVVCGLGLCPSSVYAEMAFAAATYIFRRQDPSISVPPMDLSDMEIFNPFVVKPDTPNQIFRVSAVQEASGPVQLTFRSQQGTEWKDHAKCAVSLCEKKSMMADWNSNSHLVRARSKAMGEEAYTGDVHRILRKMAYKLFKTVVDYSEEYQALDETFMNGDLPEASAKLKFQTTAADGKFIHSPYWIDSLAQLGGFCLNVNPPSGEDSVYLSHGWKSMRIIGSLSDTQQYTSYVCMQKTDEQGVYAGNVYVFNDEEVVAVCSGLKFKQMKKSLLETLLGVSSSRKLLPSTNFTQPERKLVSRTSSAPSGFRVAAPVPTTTGFSDILDTISLEAGLDPSDLSDDACLSDFGVDSILTISILQKIRDLTSLDLPSSLFTTYPTIGQLKSFFQAKLGGAQRPRTPPMRPRLSCSWTGAFPLTTVAESSRTSSPDTRSRLSRSWTEVSAASTIFSRASSRDTSPDECTPASIHSPPSADIAETLKCIIIEELGIQASEAQPSTRFSDLGLDSLLTISVLSSLREQTGVCLPSSFFTDYQTFSDLATYSEHRIPEAKAVSAGLVQSLGYKSTPALLQGIPSPGGQALFILPDGSGSALSYIDLPVISTSLPVYALNSPFYKNPSEYTLSFETVAAIFINTIKTLQARGPYLIAGWSMGGIFAYEVSRQLLEAGEEIELLIFIDSPCPRTLPPLPAPTLDILEKAGLFDGMDKLGKGITDVTRQHFLASVRTLECFEPIAINGDAKLGSVVVVWAKDGMLEGLSEGKRRAVAVSDEEIAGEAKEWLFGTRRDYGAAGWDKLVGRSVECHVVGGNHFSIMKSPQVESVGAVLKQSLQKIRKF